LRDIAEGGEDPGSPTEHHAAGSIIVDGKFAPNLGKETSSSRNKPFGFFRRLAALHHRDPNLNSSSPYQSTSFTSPSKNSNQTLIGAEALFHQPKPLSDHFNQFEVTYSHLIVFDRDSRRGKLSKNNQVLALASDHADHRFPLPTCAPTPPKSLYLGSDICHDTSNRVIWIAIFEFERDIQIQANTDRFL
jgi:hypothetical protein